MLDKDSHVPWFAWGSIDIIAAFGIALCVFVYKPLKAASLHHSHIREWWDKHEGREYHNLSIGKPEEKLEERSYPRIAGTHLSHELGGIWNPAYLPLVMCIFWLVVLIGAIVAPFSV